MTSKIISKINIIKRWCKMITGNSVFHMRQCEGKYYSKNDVKGYYSDLRHKVAGTKLIDDMGIPYNETNRGEYIYFAITIFQYGLGSYDMFLETKEILYLKKFFSIVNWALEKQQVNGSWNAFGWSTPESPYSSMAQSEGASLLCRAYKETGDEKYLLGAERAVNFMLTPVEQGGTAYYKDGQITLEEASDKLTILNGMMFSIWGLYDVCLLLDNSELKNRLDVIVNSLANILENYDRGYWSNYDLDGNIASPFYHDLHLEQLKVMVNLFGNIQFEEKLGKWEKYQSSWFKSKRAFVVKAMRKLRKINNEIAIVK